ncbi:MAG: ABC transporter permease [Verrucomicrobia bacterium]|nr:ABC transporter permease [Verrucomicrobiota bacterium]
MSLAQDSARRAPAELADYSGGVELFLRVVRRLAQLSRPPVQAALWQQVQRGALDLAGFVALIGALAGFLAIATVELGFGLGLTVGVRLLQALVLGQLAGFICALLLVTGPGTAAAWELGLMRRQGELRTLRLIGIAPFDYLVLPRVLGFGLALFVLTFVFQAAAAVGGAALAAVATQLTFSQQIEALAATLAPAALAVSALKNVVLGTVAGLLVCHHGLAESFAPAETPRVARRLLGDSLVALVIVHGGAALLLR